eukprot:c19121_g1_i2.p2 GENE.c19121_g1_i2~~c19121_g1_i2.p2  ORF type:complete len:137 (-),score=21.70 c19121_g1_i2:412-789(-)
MDNCLFDAVLTRIDGVLSRAQPNRLLSLHKTGTCVFATLAPPRITLADYVYWLLSFVSHSRECYATALVLLERVQHQRQVPITQDNIVYLLVGAMIVALRSQINNFSLEVSPSLHNHTHLLFRGL